MKWHEIKKFFNEQIAEARDQYRNIRKHIYDRCIGIVSREELEKIRTTHIAVLGTGGLGMPLLECLVRSGAENFTIVDKDIIDPTNMNRVQVAFPFTYDQKKVEVAELFMRLINPNVKIRKFETLTSENVAEVLKGVDVATLTLDGLYSSLVASKYMHDHGIPFVEGWALSGIINSRIFTPDGPSYEEIYNLNISKDYDAVTREEWAQLDDDFFISMVQLNRDIQKHYTSEGIQLMLDGNPRRSFPSFVWVISTIMATELIFKLILKRNLPERVAPDVQLYDYLRYKKLSARGQRKILKKMVEDILSSNLSVRAKTGKILKLLA